MEVTQFTYFQQVGGFDCDPVSAEITYGLERLAMYVQGVENVYDLDWDGISPKVSDDPPGTGYTYGDVFLQAEKEYSAFNFEFANTGALLAHFKDTEAECQALIGKNLALPAYDQCIKASHCFNLLDARGVISVTERQSYILRVRTLAKACCEAWLKSQGEIAA
jgi:glycyl-tRNA synthetase alpha chain